MDKLIGRRRSEVETQKCVPESYVLPPHRRAEQLSPPPLTTTIPIIDLQHKHSHRSQIIQQILNASREFGFFQVINHGIPKELMMDAMKAGNDFFELAYEEKESLNLEDKKKGFRLLTSIDYEKEKVHFWKDTITQNCHPLEEYIQYWPEKPIHYRKNVGSYSLEVRKLAVWLLDLICEGLELEKGYVLNELTNSQRMSIAHYPPCPDPTVTLGLPKHNDIDVITILQQGDVHGLQVLKDGQWLAVEPIPHAFVVNIGLILQMVSNDKIKSSEHRVVTNKNIGRTTITTFFFPSDASNIDPLKSLRDNENNTNNTASHYRSVTFKDFFATSMEDIINGLPLLDRYKISV